MPEEKKLNLGCGTKSYPDFINIDIKPPCDLICNFEIDELPFTDNSIDFIRANHILEHINNLVHFLNEIHRVLKPNKILAGEVPNALMEAAFQDPDHKRFFVLNTFHYFEWDHYFWIHHGYQYGYLPWDIELLEKIKKNIIISFRLKKISKDVVEERRNAQRIIDFVIKLVK